MIPPNAIPNNFQQFPNGPMHSPSFNSQMPNIAAPPQIMPGFHPGAVPSPNTMGESGMPMSHQPYHPMQHPMAPPVGMMQQSPRFPGQGGGGMMPTNGMMPMGHSGIRPGFPMEMGNLKIIIEKY